MLPLFVFLDKENAVVDLIAASENANLSSILLNNGVDRIEKVSTVQDLRAIFQNENNIDLSGIINNITTTLVGNDLTSFLEKYVPKKENKNEQTDSRSLSC